MKNGSIALSLSLALLGATVVLPSAQSQRRGFASAPAGRVGGIFSRGGMRAGSLRMRAAGGSYGGYAYAPYFYGDSGSDYTPDYEPSPLFLPQSFVETAPPEPPAKPAEPLLVELQGDRWVRITPYALPQTNGQLAGQASAPLPERTPPPAKATAASAQSPPAKPAPLPPAVLVFRDGHQEEIGQYRIMGATIYLNTDYWTSGAWTRAVPIADLDVPATLKLNRQRGANFRLPSGPNEVMIGG